MDKFSPDRIEVQLERVLGSSEFMAGRRLGQFLRYVVEQALNGHSGSMDQYTIAVEAFGYGPDFDPVSNPAVRILARRLRRALDQYFLTQGSDDPIRIDIPKGGYVPVFLDNHAMPKESVPYECPTPAVEVPTLDVSRPTIAIMAFDVLNTDGAFDHVATGLTEEIIITLTQFPEFLVVGPLNRAIILQNQLDTNGIGQQYRVRFLLDGTLRIHKDMLRLTVRLADTLSGQHLWGHSFDVNMQIDSMMAFQDDLVGQVAATIADSYGIIPRTLTNESLARSADNPDAYVAVLHYYHHFRVLTPESFINAMNALEKSVQKNPDHALSKAALGDLFASSYLFGYDDNSSILEHTEVLAHKAVALDPNCQVARWTMALVYFLYYQRRLFLNEAKQVLRLNPNNALFVAAASLHIAMVGEWELAMKMIRKAIRLNPHHPGWYHILAFMNYYRQEEYDRALIAAQRFNTPEFFWDPLIRAAVLGKLDRHPDAKQAVKQLLDLVPDFKRRGPDLIRRLAFLDEHVDMLMEGLQKAGLEFHSN